jgi:hypothetical protein
VDLYVFANLFYDLYRMNLFAPLRHVPPLEYPYILEKLFGPLPILNEIIDEANQDFFEHLRIEVLHINGFFTIDGYYRSKDDIEDITPLLN